jgi:PBSX family phage terminase large subunit
MIFDPNDLFYEMVRIYKENYSPDNKVIICNEGSSRSSKTWDFFHFLVMYCDHNQNASNEIYILRETLVNCRDFTLKEFKNCLKAMKIWDDDNYTGSPKPYYNLYGNDVFFRGLDDSSEGYPSDILFINEALENKNKEKIDGLRMRCRKLIVMDWNPKFTQHWAFKLEGQPNTFFTHSTYSNNKHLQKSVIAEIESYEPTHPEDRHLPEKERRPHPTNIKNGTADDYRWQVYGLGLRCSPEGLIFRHVNSIDKWPEDIAPVHGLDFGFTVDPSALVKVGENSTDIYLELLMYEPTEKPSIIDSFAQEKKINTKIPCTADSSDKYTGENKGTVEMVKGLKNLGWNISKVSKTKSIMYWLNEMKGKRINVIENEFSHFIKIELENYRLKTVNGIAINQPIDGFDHAISAGRYGYMSLHKPGIEPNENYF